MLAYFAQKLYICGKKLKKSRILWWTRISPGRCILDPGYEMAVCCVNKASFAMILGSAPAAWAPRDPGVPLWSESRNRYCWEISRYEEDDTQIYNSDKPLHADMSQLHQIHIGGLASQQGRLASYQAFLVITIQCNIRRKGSLLSFLVFYYSHSLTGMAPIELYAGVLIYYLPLCVLSSSIPLIFLIFAALKRNKRNNIGTASTSTYERMLQ